MIVANIFGPDLGYVVIIVLVVMLGGSQLPKIARNIGTAGKEFRKAQREAEEEEAQHQQARQAQPSLGTPQVDLANLPQAQEHQVRREAAG